MNCTGKALSKWLVNHPLGKAKDPAESRAVFVVRVIGVTNAHAYSSQTPVGSMNNHH